MAVSALRSSQVHAGNKTTVTPQIKSKHCLFQLLLKHLLAKSSLRKQRMWLDHPHIPHSSSHRPVGTRSAPRKGMLSLDESPVINQVMSFQKWLFMQLFQWPQDYLQAISLSVFSKLKTIKCSCHWIHWNATLGMMSHRRPQGWIPISGLLSLPTTQVKSPWTGRSLICLSVVQKLSALVHHSEPCKHTNDTLCALGSATWMHHWGQSLSHMSLSDPTVPLLLHSCLLLLHPQPELHCALSAFHPNPLPGLQPALLN